MEIAFLVVCCVTIGCGSEINIALQKPARQSSTQQSLWELRRASNAVDGNTDPVYSHASCSHTNSIYFQWWEVDLFGFYEIQKVVLFNRLECSDCADRLRNFTIEVFWNDRLMFVNEESQLCATYPETVGDNVTVECAPGVRGRFVKITLYNGDNPLTLCEVEVYGTAVPKEGVVFRRLPDSNHTSPYEVDIVCIFQCGDICYKNNTCFAFTYNMESHECLLLDRYAVKGEPWLYFEIFKLSRNRECN